MIDEKLVKKKIIIKEKIMVEILKVTCNNEGIEKIARIIEKGGIAIFPTDTVYGMGCNPYNEEVSKKNL